MYQHELSNVKAAIQTTREIISHFLIKRSGMKPGLCSFFRKKANDLKISI